MNIEKLFILANNLWKEKVYSICGKFDVFNADFYQFNQINL